MTEAFKLVRPEMIESRYVSDGTRYTGLVREFLRGYLPLCGARPSKFSVNGVTYRQDGGVDGHIDAPNLQDPLKLFSPLTVCQFKAGDAETSKAKSELTKEPDVGSQRIKAFIEQDYKLVWFVAKALSDIDVKAFEDTLYEIVKGINQKSPRPTVIDSSRLADYLNQLPALAVSITGPQETGLITVGRMLANPPHSQLQFVPPEHFDSFQQDLEDFIFNQPDEVIRYFAGEPGIGKTRSILEVLNANDALRVSSAYYENQQNASAILGIAKQHQLRMVIVVDEYVGHVGGAPRIDDSTVPFGCKAIVIGHAFQTNRENRAFLQITPLSKDDVKAILRKSYSSLSEPTLDQVASYARQNIRLANWLAKELASQSSLDLTISAERLDQLVAREMDRDAESREVLMLLSLLPTLQADERESFCTLVGYADPENFRKACLYSHQHSGFIHSNEYISYVAIPAIGHTALIRLWIEDRERVKKVLAKAGSFEDRILQRVLDLPPGAEKEGMLDFFRPAEGLTSLDQLIDGDAGSRFLALLTADPDKYLPRVHDVLERERARLKEFKYEGHGLSRRSLIWTLRDLAQFGEYFHACERIVYWLAYDEVPSSYSNTATSYWQEWFRAYFHHTQTPYADRLDIIESRIDSFDARTYSITLGAIVNPFPHMGMNIPSDIVGGRLVPPQARASTRADIRYAAERIPRLLCKMLDLGDEGFRSDLANALKTSGHSWLERLGSAKALASIINSPNFPTFAKQQILVRARDYPLLFDDDRPPDQRAQYLIKAYAELAELCKSESDPLQDALLVLESNEYQIERKQTLKDLEEQVRMRFLTDEAFAESLREALVSPESHAANLFGYRVGLCIDSKRAWPYLESSISEGLLPFYNGLLRGVIEVGSIPAEDIALWIDQNEHRNPLWAYSVRYVLGARRFIAAANRMFRTGLIGPRNLHIGYVLASELDYDQTGELLAAICDALDRGDNEAAEAAISIAEAFENLAHEDEGAQQFALRAFLAFTSNTPGSNRMHSWASIGEWLLERYAPEIIPRAALFEQADYSPATQLLRKAAPNHGMLVLNALHNKLLHRFDPPYLFAGSLTPILEAIEPSVFLEWLDANGTEEAVSISGHLPRPVMGGDGQPHVPGVTRAFWDRHPPGSERFEDMMEEFQAHTFSTGVYGGFGIDLFSERVKLAEALSYDSNPAISTWASWFLKDSEFHLDRAKKESAIHDAHVDLQ